jgi:hypothetical protein
VGGEEHRGGQDACGERRDDAESVVPGRSLLKVERRPAAVDAAGKHRAGNKSVGGSDVAGVARMGGRAATASAAPA